MTKAEKNRLLMTHIDMSEEEYRAAPGVNKSTLWMLNASPKHYRYGLEHPAEDTPALKLGRAVHEGVLRPEEFVKHYTQGIAVDRRTKDGKAAWEAFLRESGDKTVLNADEMETVVGISSAIWGSVERNELGNKYAIGLLDEALTEVPLFWTDGNGVACKCRLDAIRVTDDRIIVVDLKTTGDARKRMFKRSGLKYGYHVQAAHYIDGVRTVLGDDLPIEWWFIAVEKKAPYAMNVIRAGNSYIDRGVLERNELMEKLIRCAETDTWDDYGCSVMELEDYEMLPDDDDDE